MRGAGQRLQMHSAPSVPLPCYLFDLDETCLLSGMWGQGVSILCVLKNVIQWLWSHSVENGVYY